MAAISIHNRKKTASHNVSLSRWCTPFFIHNLARNITVTHGTVQYIRNLYRPSSTLIRTKQFVPLVYYNYYCGYGQAYFVIVSTFPLCFTVCRTRNTQQVFYSVSSFTACILYMTYSVENWAYLTLAAEIKRLSNWNLDFYVASSFFLFLFFGVAKI